ncbi:hypothetical protein IE4803_PB00173 (plasmid) [Rhizobium etli bv. phaseoli str. IE4803]|nr:hypothetical protein IE4803_PB00173 [Rhizobium etli bv. phaseoli str. IE4803]
MPTSVAEAAKFHSARPRSAQIIANRSSGMSFAWYHFEEDPTIGLTSFLQTTEAQPIQAIRGLNLVTPAIL